VERLSFVSRCIALLQQLDAKPNLQLYELARGLTSHSVSTQVSAAQHQQVQTWQTI
jgi:hypothetical protein